MGAKPHPDYDRAAWVRGRFPPEAAKAMPDRDPDIEPAGRLIRDGKLGEAQNRCNR